MKNKILIFPQIAGKEKKKSPYKMFDLLAFATIYGGFLAIFAGFIFIIVHALLKADTIFNQIGTALMIVSIPMLLIGGHFMDKAAEKKNHDF